MFKKFFIFVLLSILSTSAFAASAIKCTLTDNGQLVNTFSAELDAGGNAELETDQYDKFFFGGVAEGGIVTMVWSMSPLEEEKQSSEPLDLTEISSRGTEINFACDIID